MPDTESTEQLTKQCRVIGGQSPATSQRNMPPVSKLPGDILLTIWQMLPLETKISVTHTCSLWRKLAISMPLLWNRFEMRQDLCFAVDRRSGGVVRDRTLDRSVVLLQRSAAAPLHITIRFNQVSRWDSDDVGLIKYCANAEIFDVLKSHYSRIRELVAFVPSETLNFLLTQCDHLGRLETLRLLDQWPQLLDITGSILSELQRKAPALQKLHLDFNTLTQPMIANITLGSVRELTACFSNQEIRTSARQLLVTFPSLEVLRLRSVPPYFVSDRSNEKHLPALAARLRMLHLDGLDEENMLDGLDEENMQEHVAQHGKLWRSLFVTMALPPTPDPVVMQRQLKAIRHFFAPDAGLSEVVELSFTTPPSAATEEFDIRPNHGGWECVVTANDTQGKTRSLALDMHQWLRVWSAEYFAQTVLQRQRLQQLQEIELPWAARFALLDAAFIFKLRAMRIIKLYLHNKWDSDENALAATRVARSMMRELSAPERIERFYAVSPTSVLLPALKEVFIEGQHGFPTRLKVHELFEFVELAARRKQELHVQVQRVVLDGGTENGNVVDRLAQRGVSLSIDEAI